MEANDFIVRLKADGTEKDACDLQSISNQYKNILRSLGVKDKGSFSLNVLCILCRNLEKVPSWRDRIDGKALVSLSIDCVRETRNLTHTDQVKTLACIYHLHKHAVKLTSLVPPEIVLKLSYMPFDDTRLLLEEYCKTYWNILADRLTYIEKLKTKHSVSKLLKQLSDDSAKIIKIYDSVQFCSNILTFLIKKLHCIYNDTNAKDLCKTFGEIFNSLSTKQDLSDFSKLTDKQLLDMYTKLCDCFYVISENASKIQFKESVLKTAIRTVITMIGHKKEILRNLEIFFLNGFCSVFEDPKNTSNTESILTNMVAFCINIEKSGNELIMYATYPFLNQHLRLFIEYSVANIDGTNIYFNEKIQHACLNFMLFLSSKKAEQHIKCENCKVKSGFHDTLRLLFLIKHFPITCISYNIDVNKIMPTYYKLVLMQHKILFELKRLGCINHEKCFRKLQTDIHNTAISLNKANQYEYSIKLFNIYIEVELRYFKDGNELKNVSRALYNKSICELDCKLYDEAVNDAFLSLIFSLPDGLNSEKYMSLIMDIKAKQLKHNDGNNEEFQLITVLDACNTSLENNKYGNLKPFFIALKFSELLKHEFTMYAKLWPSIGPIAGVWRSLIELLKKCQASWVKAETKDVISWTLYEIVLETPTIVRTIHNEHYTSVVTDLIAMFGEDVDKTTELDLVYAALLFLKCEYDLSEASNRHGWKNTEPTMDPDQAQGIRTISQEYEASKRAVEAVDILTRVVQYIDEVPKTRWLPNALHLYQIFVMHLLNLCKTLPALQLANICCKIAQHIEDSESYVINASVIISHATKNTPEVMRLVSECSSLCNEVSLQTSLCFLCDVAIYYSKCGSPGMSARLVQMAQVKMLKALELQPEINLDLAIGRLAEAQYMICGSLNALSTVSGIQRHYLSITNTETKWRPRRQLAASLKKLVSSSSLAAAALCRALLLWRRARCACAVALPAVGAAAQALLFVHITNAHILIDAQTKIDNRLKHILGLQPSNEAQHQREEIPKPPMFTPRHENLETMLENMVFKKTQTSPSVPCTSVYGYKVPEFVYHKNCTCCLCDNPYSLIIACISSGLESAMFFRAKEFDIARNYFEGSLKTFELAESKLQSYFECHKDRFDVWLVDMVRDVVFDDFKHMQIEVLIEAAFFELSQSYFDRADDLIVRIYEIMQDTRFLNAYLKNDVMNLVTVSAHLRRDKSNIAIESNLESEMENLKITPDVEPPKTPELKAKVPPKITKNLVKDEELPNVKRKVIKLNLDDAEEKEVVKSGRRKPEFKIPVPITSKAVLENITPRTRSKPAILVTKPSLEVEVTPKPEKFFTPTSTPEEFFTPMSSIKTYSKKSLRSNIVKNLEAEFATPKGDKENSKNVAGSSQIPKTVRTKSRTEKSSLKRATSPGKLGNEKSTRSRMKAFNIHEDKK